MKNIFGKIIRKREIQLLLIIIVITLVFGMISEYFFTMDNFRLLMLVISTNSIVAVGMTILIISGGFDLSAGSVFAALGMLLGLLLVSGLPIFISIIIILVLGAGIGAGTGAVVAKLKVNPFILTLGTFFLFRGLAFIIGTLSSIQTDTVSISSITNFPEAFNRIGGGDFYGIEYMVFYMIFIIIVFYFLLSKNVWFRQNFYIGGNETAARLVGINVDRIKIFNYTLISILVSVAAILRVSRLKSAAAGSGENMALIVIAAVVIGGASLEGGKGSIPGSILGVILISIIQNGLIVIGTNPYYEKLFIGGFLLISVLINKYSKRTPARKIIRT